MMRGARVLPSSGSVRRLANRSRASSITAIAAILALLEGCGAAPVADPSALASAPSRAAVTASPSAAPAALEHLPDGSLVPGVDAQLLRETLGVWVYGSELVFETGDAVGIFDTRTERLVASFALPEAPQINGVLLTADSLWVLDHDRGRVIRLDRTTGEELAAIEIGGRAVSLTETPDGIWAGSAHVVPESVALIDPATNQVVRRLEVGAFPSYGAGNLWFGRDETGNDITVREIDPESGDEVSSIDLGDGDGCYIGGSFPDVVWSWCFEPPPIDTVMTRLDVERSQGAATIPLTSAGGLVGVSGDHSWFSEEHGGTLALMRASNATNAIERVWQADLDEPYGLIGDTMWIVNRERGELRRVVLATE
jgi:hypothetical protein